MEDLNKYRMQIDELDKSIMDLLDQRLNIARKIGRVKKQEKIATLDKNREIDILKSADKYKNSKQIKDIYSQIFKSSKDVQEYNYFLVGKSLDYSYSPKYIVCLE